jgi:hypothetical protein
VRGSSAKNVSCAADSGSIIRALNYTYVGVRVRVIRRLRCSRGARHVGSVHPCRDRDARPQLSFDATCPLAANGAICLARERLTENDRPVDRQIDRPMPCRWALSCRNGFRRAQRPSVHPSSFKPRQPRRPKEKPPEGCEAWRFQSTSTDCRAWKVSSIRKERPEPLFSCFYGQGRHRPVSSIYSPDVES